MSILREVLAKFGIEADSEPLERLDSATDGAISKLEKLAGVVAEGFLVKKLVEFAVGMSEVGDEIAKTSGRLGLSTDGLQSWRHAAKLSGIDAAELDGTLQILQRNQAAAASGSKEQAEAFHKLGVATKDGAGQLRSLDDMLPDIAEGIKKTQNPTERAALAMKLFGRSGARLLPLLAEGADGVAELRAEFADLGGGMDAETVKQSEELNDELDRMSLSFFSIKSRVAGVLIPILTRMVDAVVHASTGFFRLINGTHLVQAALVVLGGVLAVFAVQTLIAFAGPIAIAAVFAVAIGFIILVIDDLISLFTGGESVIGDFLDAMFGAGTAEQVVRSLTDAWDGMVLAVKDAIHAVKDFFGLDTSDGPKPPDVSSWAAQTYGQSTPGHPTGNARATAITSGPGGPRTAMVPVAGRSASIPTRAGAGGAGGAGSHVDARTTAVIQVAPGTDRVQRENIRRAVGDVMDERNRQTAAALGSEALPEPA